MDYPEIYEIRYTDPSDNTIKTFGEKTTDKELAIFTRDQLHAQGYIEPHIQYTFETGGIIQHAFELTFYRGMGEEEGTNETIDKTKAELWLSRLDQDGGTKTLFKRVAKYKFIGELDSENDEKMEDYPIQDYYDDGNFYKLIDEGESVEVESKTEESSGEIVSQEKRKASEILAVVTRYFEKKYPINESGGLFFRKSYYFIVPISGTDKTIEMRLSNHSGNPNNIETKSTIKLKSEIVRGSNEPKEIDLSDENLYEVDNTSMADIGIRTFYQVKQKNRVALLSNIIFYQDNDTKGKFDKRDYPYFETEYDLSKQGYTAEDIIESIEEEINDTIVQRRNDIDTFAAGGILPQAEKVKVGFRPEFLSTPIIYGRNIEISMPNGEKRKAQFAIVDAKNILASHNENNFSNTIGYPTINNENVNDRNYKDDKNAQIKVIEVAQTLDPNILVSSSRTPSGTPIITPDGIVVSGNNRTMSIKLAIEQYPEKYEEYKQFLADEAFVFGFDELERMAILIGEPIVDTRLHPVEDYRDNKYITIKKPILVRIDYDFPEYNTTELSKYNKETKKSERPIDKAIKIGKMLAENEGCRNIISELVGSYETFSQFYSNYADQVKLRDTLISCNIITKNELAGFFDERGFNASGKELIENLLAGMVLSKDALIAGSMAGGRQFKNIVITSLPVLAKNASLGEFSLIETLNKAFLLEKNIHDSGLNFDDYVVQGNMFDEAPERNVLIMNRLLSEGRNKFKSSIEAYNTSAIDNENASLFGEKPTKQEMFDAYITNKINPESMALINKANTALEKGIAVEKEHQETFEKLSSGTITVAEAIKETAAEHIKDDPEYYDKLEKMEESEAMKFVKDLYPSAKAVKEKNRYAIIDGRNVEISWISMNPKSEQEAWGNAKDAILGRSKSVKKMNEPSTIKANFQGHEFDMPVETAQKVLNIQKILRSTPSRNMLINDNWYQQYPNKILGEPYQASGRFGEVTKYKGKIDSVNRIDAPLNFMQINIAENPTISFHNESIQQLLIDPQAQQNIEASLISTKKEAIINKIKKHTKAVSRIGASSALSTADVYSFEQVYSMKDEKGISINNPEISPEELQVFVWYKEQIGHPLSPKWYALANYTPQTFTKEWVTKGLVYHFRNELIPAYLYFSGNIWEKQSALTTEKATIIELYGESVFNNQKQLLDNVFKVSYDKRSTLTDANFANRLKLLPISKFANQTMVKTLSNEKEFKMKVSPASGKHPGRPDFLHVGHISEYKKEVFKELSLTEAFQYWLIEYKSEYEIIKDTTYAEIITIYINQRSRPGISEDATAAQKKEHEAIWQRKVNITKEEGDRLFSIFMADQLLLSDIARIETTWNEKYNGFLPINYNKIPVAFSHAKEYNNSIVDIRPEKREAIAFLMNEGNGCLAYDVGVGKTFAALFTIKQFLDAGYCKRPFICVPNQVYKQFMAEGKGLLPDVKFNDLYNLSADYIDELRGPDGKIEMLPEGSISLITYDGLERIGFSQHTADDLLYDLANILDQSPDAPPDFSKKGQKKEAAIMERLKTLIGRGLRGTLLDIEDLGFDFFCSDEAHKMKKVFVSVKGETKTTGEKGEREKSPYQIQSGGEPSSIALKGFMLSQYIQKNNDGRNVFTLTATPFTNSPLEVFSVLAFLAYSKLREMGLHNLKTFFDTYVHATNELTINAKLKPERKQVVLGFNNLKSLQQLIARFINYKTGEMVKVKRPNKYVLPFRSVTIDGKVTIASPEQRIDTNLPLSAQQESMMNDIKSYAEGKTSLGEICAMPEPEKIEGSADNDDTVDATEGVELDENSLTSDEKAGVRVLRSLNFARNLALSPYLYNCSGLGKNPTAAQYIETSPKLMYTMECIRSVKAHHEKAGTPVSGQVIYMDRGIQFFGLIKQYLIEVIGYKEHEVGMIYSQMKGGKDAKEITKMFFLGQKYDEATGELLDIPEAQRMKILIGSSTIEEGINLQRHSTILYDLWIGWNPTQQKQKEGRIWRQGNLFGSVRIVIPMMENSMDVFIFQKLEEKTARIAEIWDTQGETNTFNLQEFNPGEIKKALISDPFVLAEMELIEDKEKIQDDIRGVKNEIHHIDQIIEAKTYFDSNIEDLEEWVSEYRPAGKSEKRNISTLIALTNDIMKKQTDAEGKKMEYKHSKVYGGKNPIDYSDKEPAYKPYYFDRLVLAHRTLAKAEREYIVPKQLTVAKLPKYKEALAAKITNLEEQMKSVVSEQSIKMRADYITQERIANKVETVGVMGRVKEFEKLNYLLNDKQAKKIQTKPITLDCPPKDENGVLRIDKDAIEHLTKCINDLPQTKILNIDKDGNYTDQRKNLHKKIRSMFLNDVTCIKQNKPIAILTGGAPGSGKSHFLKNYAPYLLSKDIYHIDADEVRAQIPEYAKWTDPTGKKMQGWNASCTHFETKDIVDEMIQHIGGTCRYDLVYDGTMNKAKKYYDLINKLKAVGYDVFIIYLDIPQQISETRVLDRYQRTGRFVPMDVVQEVFDAGHEALNQIKKMVNGYIIVDGLTGQVTDTGGNAIPQDRNYSMLSKTDNFVESKAKGDGERARKIKLAKAKAAAQLMRIRILEITKLAKGGEIAKFDKLPKNKQANKNYTHFAVEKTSGKIVDGWETISDIESLKYYAKGDLKDNFPDHKPSDFKIVSAKQLIREGINPYDFDNWLKIGETFENGGKIPYKKVILLGDEDRTDGIPVYYVVGETENNYTVVIDEKMDLWKGASELHRAEYYQEVIPKSEFNPSFATGGVINYPDQTEKEPVIINDDAVLFDIDADGETIAKKAKAKTVREITLKLRDTDIIQQKITNSRDINSFLRKIWDEDSINIQEEFYVLLLNRANVIISYEAFSKGGTSGTVVDKKIILALATKALAESVVIAHNHPSGNLVPSEPDKKITRELKEALKIADIGLLDHLIIVPDPDKYYSFADNGIMH